MIEYPTSFLSHMGKQKLNVFNIGVAFLTLSLSSQLVTYKQKFEKAVEEKTQLSEKVEVLEQMVVDLGGELPDAAAVAAAAAAAQEKAQRDRDEEAKALAALTSAVSSDDKKPKKGMLI
ncbi:hypothetical protein BBJ28_00006748 [Nothophytophthora sp. Chile5]|nr:hypothetical protein BBJ28_00006748 [Nothophytophthora sp. Chile5]